MNKGLLKVVGAAVGSAMGAVVSYVFVKKATEAINAKRIATNPVDSAWKDIQMLTKKYPNCKDELTHARILYNKVNKLGLNNEIKKVYLDMMANHISGLEEKEAEIKSEAEKKAELERECKVVCDYLDGIEEHTDYSTSQKLKAIINIQELYDSKQYENESTEKHLSEMLKDVKIVPKVLEIKARLIDKLDKETILDGSRIQSIKATVLSLEEIRVNTIKNKLPESSNLVAIEGMIRLIDESIETSRTNTSDLWNSDDILEMYTLRERLAQEADEEPNKLLFLSDVNGENFEGADFINLKYKYGKLSGSMTIDNANESKTLRLQDCHMNCIESYGEDFKFVCEAINLAVMNKSLEDALSELRSIQ